MIRDVLSLVEVKQSTDEIWNHALFEVDRDDPQSWEKNWPVPGEGRGSRGFLQSLNEYDDVQAMKNRQNESIVKVFQNILQTEKLWAVVGRHGIMRPTKGIKLKDGSIVDKPGWKTDSDWLHWDQNPWREPDFVRVQGMLTLTDHTEDSGGFCCVVGFHKLFKQWQSDNPLDTVEGASWSHSLIYVPKTDPIQQKKTKILMKAGSLLIWDSRLPHQNFPNDNDSFRLVQYCTYDPVVESEAEEKKKQLRDKMETGLTGSLFPTYLTDLGRKLLGLELWGEQGDTTYHQPTPLTERQKEALKHLNEAKQLESDGEPTKAVILYKKALKLNPKLEAFFQ